MTSGSMIGSTASTGFLSMSSQRTACFSAEYSSRRVLFALHDRGDLGRYSWAFLTNTISVYPGGMSKPLHRPTLATSHARS